jgi:exo-1,4-beta-D-glucosaminidase
MAYEGVRAMYEAYSRNKYTSTGVVQWMLNNAWPSMIWHLYDRALPPLSGAHDVERLRPSGNLRAAHQESPSVVVARPLGEQGSYLVPGEEPG